MRMIMYMRYVSFVLILLILPWIPLVHGVTYSQPNYIYDYQANGSGDGISVNATSPFAMVLYHGHEILFSALQSYQWTAINYILIVLANTTESTFYLAWLELRNGDSQFWLWLYDYELGTVNIYSLTGTQHVDYSNLLWSPSMPMPILKFKTESKYMNGVYVTGPEVSLNRGGGYYNGTKAYVLMNFYNVSNSWHEVWLLTQDYHFIILYAYLQPRNPLDVGLVLNLKDYSIDARVRQIGTWMISQTVATTTQTISATIKSTTKSTTIRTTTTTIPHHPSRDKTRSDSKSEG